MYTLPLLISHPAPTELYTLSLHDALPISHAGDLVGLLDRLERHAASQRHADEGGRAELEPIEQDRKSTRLNSSHGYISYAVFCLKKKKTMRHIRDNRGRRT